MVCAHACICVGGGCFCHLVNECFTSDSHNSVFQSFWVLDVISEYFKLLDINIYMLHFLLEMVWKTVVTSYLGFLSIL
jgi:hypothetical protein